MPEVWGRDRFSGTCTLTSTVHGLGAETSRALSGSAPLVAEGHLLELGDGLFALTLDGLELLLEELREPDVAYLHATELDTIGWHP